jgi:hypothetical protein
MEESQLLISQQSRNPSGLHSDGTSRAGSPAGHRSLRRCMPRAGVAARMLMQPAKWFGLVESTREKPGATGDTTSGAGFESG